MTYIYVVIESDGDYSDYYLRNVAFCDTFEKAVDMVVYLLYKDQIDPDKNYMKIGNNNIFRNERASKYFIDKSKISCVNDHELNDIKNQTNEIDDPESDDGDIHQFGWINNTLVVRKTMYNDDCYHRTDEFDKGETIDFVKSDKFIKYEKMINETCGIKGSDTESK
jgi:hypothetical protein